MRKEYPRLRELVYIIERVAVRVRHTALRERLLARGIDLLEAYGFQDFDRIMKTAVVIEELLVLGRELYEIEPFTVDCLQIELQELTSAIRQSALPKEMPYLEALFNTSAIRQSAIADRIKQCADMGCQMKEITTSFPDVSERTLRYDINKLVDKGVIKRVGIGSGSYYKMPISAHGNNTQPPSLS